MSDEKQGQLKFAASYYQPFIKVLIKRSDKINRLCINFEVEKNNKVAKRGGNKLRKNLFGEICEYAGNRDT